MSILTTLPHGVMAGVGPNSVLSAGKQGCLRYVKIFKQRMPARAILMEHGSTYTVLGESLSLSYLPFRNSLSMCAMKMNGMMIYL